MNLKLPKKRRTSRTLMALILGSAAMALQSCSSDILTGQPDWLGNSIYERLQDDGNYTYTLRLIDDLGQKSVLSQTGSKTLFAADDDAYRKFFQSNQWGVKSYEQLSTAQKKLLLNSSMVNNAYLIELLSNVSGNPPSEGECMRRETAASVYDSVARMMPADMPQTKYWDVARTHKNGIVLLRDNTSKPMIHFLPAYMQLNKITDNDLSILTNGEATSASEAWVNGKKVIERDIACKNGYIQKVEGVMTSADNMDEIIHNHANMSTFKHLIDRFSAPYYDDAATKTYQRLYNSSDSVFVLKYFASCANATNNVNQTTPEGETVSTLLSFDPGWNQYMYTNTQGHDLHYDAGAMLVPSNTAMNYWWNHDGKVLQDMYHSWDNVPSTVLLKLININMINSFSETVPSKFNNIVDNTTKVSIGIKPENVDSCFMGCNGVVYLINKVFTPADYSSVSFPALIHSEDNMKVIYWGIDNLNFEPYLNSMDSYYSFFIPTDDAMLTYVDPCSYGTTNTILYKFYYNDNTKTVGAHRYYYDIQKKQIVENARTLTDATQAEVNNRLEDLINNLIVVGNVEDGGTYYKTKGGTVLKIEHPGQAGKMTVASGLQIENNDAVSVNSVYDQTGNGNGKAYLMDGGMPLTSANSTYAILKNNPEYEQFYKLLSGSSLLSTTYPGSTYTCVDKNINIFDAYNYTVYVPTNASIKNLIDKGYLPTWEDYENLTADDFGGDATALRNARTKLQNIITNFLRYHIQDNSVFVGQGGSAINGYSYESAMMNPSNRRFYPITVTASNSGLTLVDYLNNTHKVTMKSGLYNTPGREYWIDKSRSTSLLYNASDVVIHQIDSPMFYSKDQLKPWKEVIGLTSASSKKFHALSRRR